MNIAFGVECRAYRADAPIHHVGRGDDVNAGCRVDERLALQHRDRFIVEHVARFVDHAVLPMGGVRIKRDVGDHAQFRKPLFQRGNRARHQSFRVGRFTAIGGFFAALDGGENRQRRNAELNTVFGVCQQFVYCIAPDAGH